jgi:hypothetical protein
MSIGLAWIIQDSRYLWHDGGTGGFETFLGFDPVTKNVVVALSNAISPNGSPTQKLGLKVLQVLAGAYPTPIDIPPTLTLPSTTLDRYVGTYQGTISGQNVSFKILHQDNDLYLSVPGQGNFRMYAKAEDKFYLRLAAVDISFQKDSAGNYDSFIFNQEGIGQFSFTRGS